MDKIVFFQIVLLVANFLRDLIALLEQSDHSKKLEVSGELR